MSLTKPDKYDNISYNLDVYREFLSDPKLRNNSEFVKYFIDLTEKSVKIYMKLNKYKKVKISERT